MTTITSTVLGASGRFVELSGSILNNLRPITVMAYYRPTAGGSENGSGNLISKVPSASLNGLRLAVSHNSNLPRYAFGGDSVGIPGAPNRASANSSITYGSWQHCMMTWDGTTVAASTALRVYRGIGVDMTEPTYATTGNGSGSAEDDAEEVMYLLNRVGLDRAVVADVAYVVAWNRIVTLAEGIIAQNNGPMALGKPIFIYVNQSLQAPHHLSDADIVTQTIANGALPPNTLIGDAISIDGDDERMSVDTDRSYITGVGNAAVINIAPKLQVNETVSNETRWQVPVAKITGMLGITPTFQLINYGSGVGKFWQHPWDNPDKMMFRYVGSSIWTQFANLTVNADNIQFSHNAAFDEDEIIISPHELYTSVERAQLINSISESDVVTSTNSSDVDFIVDNYAPQTDTTVRTSPSDLSLYAFKIEDTEESPPAGQAKRTMVLVEGVHAGEDLGSWVFDYFIRHIFGASPEAIAIRSNFKIYCYMNVNAPGRYLGGFRGGWVTEADGGNDANRNMDDADCELEIVTIPRAALAADLPEHVHVAIDFHQNWANQRAMYTNGTNGDLWYTTLDAIFGATTFDDLGPSTAGSFTHHFFTEYTADFATTIEVGEVTGTFALSDAEDFATKLAQSIEDLLDNGDIPIVVAPSGSAMDLITRRRRRRS